jgi:hypothetical protein
MHDIQKIFAQNRIFPPLSFVLEFIRNLLAAEPQPKRVLKMPKVP